MHALDPTTSGPVRGQQFLENLSEHGLELPFDPVLMQDLFAMTGDNAAASLDAVADVIAQDPGLTTTILGLANSAFYGLQSEVTSVGRAVAVLGVRELRNVVLMLGVGSLVKNQRPPEGFDLREAWRHQLKVASTARLLREAFEDNDTATEGVAPPPPLPDADTLFTAGLLHDVGKLLMALFAPEDWKAVHGRVMLENISFRRAEDEHWGLDHGLVGALALKGWNLPEGLTEPVSWHHAPSACPQPHRAAAVILHLADAIAWDMDGHPAAKVDTDFIATVLGPMDYEDLSQRALAALDLAALNDMARRLAA